MLLLRTLQYAPFLHKAPFLPIWNQVPFSIRLRVNRVVRVTHWRIRIHLLQKASIYPTCARIIFGISFWICTPEDIRVLLQELLGIGWVVGNNAIMWKLNLPYVLSHSFFKSLLILSVS